MVECHVPNNLKLNFVTFKIGVPITLIPISINEPKLLIRTHPFGQLNLFLYIFHSIPLHLNIYFYNSTTVDCRLESSEAYENIQFFDIMLRPGYCT